MKKRTLVIAAMIAVFSGFIFAAGSTETNEINLYSIMPEKYASQILGQFTKDTGIKVNFTRLSAGEALARLIAEKDNPQVDALWGGPSDTYDAGVKEGLFYAYKPAEADKIPANYQSKDHYWTGIGIIPLCFMTNTDFLSKNGIEPPSSWYDLLDPVYKDGLQMADARTSGTATERIYSLIQAFGDEDKAFEFQKELNKNVQLYTKGGAGGCLPIGQGQAAAGIFYLVDALDIAHQGYPVVITFPKEGVTYGIEGSGIIKGAKNLEGAKALMDWASSKSLGNFMAANKISYIPTRPDVEVTDPALDTSKVKFNECDSEWKGENRERLVNRWVNEIM